jgi:hypothetical protein
VLRGHSSFEGQAHFLSDVVECGCGFVPLGAGDMVPRIILKYCRESGDLIFRAPWLIPPEVFSSSTRYRIDHRLDSYRLEYSSNDTLA